MTEKADEIDVFDPQRWGLPDEAVADLADRLWRIWSRFRHCFKTKTRDTGAHAWVYLRGLLTMLTKQAHPRDPQLAAQLEVEVLPALSMANVREMLQAVLPLKQLSPEQATRLVVRHLVHRSRSTSSRLKAQRRIRDPA